MEFKKRSDPYTNKSKRNASNIALPSIRPQKTFLSVELRKFANFVKACLRHKIK